MKQRGRPRQFDKNHVSQSMMELFWRQGFAATSLDQIADVTKVNRPSLYSTFGNKMDMFLMCLGRFSDKMSKLAKATMGEAQTLEYGLHSFFNGLIEIYYDEDGDDLQLGCFVFSTAIAESPGNVEIKDAVRTALDQVHHELRNLIATHRPQLATKEIDVAADTAVSIFLSIGVRVRAGMNRSDVEKAIENSVKATLKAVG